MNREKITKIIGFLSILAPVYKVVGVVLFFWLLGFSLSGFIMINKMPTILGWVIIFVAGMSIPVNYYATKQTNKPYGKGLSFLVMILSLLIYGASGSVFASTIYTIYFVELIIINNLLASFLLDGVKRKWVVVGHTLLLLSAIANFWFMNLHVASMLAIAQVFFVFLTHLLNRDEPTRESDIQSQQGAIKE